MEAQRRRCGWAGAGLARVRLFFGLPRGDRFRLLAAVGLLPLVRLSLKATTLPRTRRWLDLLGPRRRNARLAFDEAAEGVRRAIDTVHPYAPRATCLPRALVAKRMLAWEGHDAALVIGVAKSAAGAIEAHAWLEHDGVVVVGDLDDLDRYARFPMLDSLGTI